MLMRIDVFYKADMGSAPVLDLRRGWDGCMYGETNILEVCGPDRLLYSGSFTQPAWVADDSGKAHMTCSSATIPK
jgi:hypothetical protein